MSTNVNYTKFIIDKSDTAYKQKDQLKTFGIYYDFDKDELFSIVKQYNR